jgi:hypothetical protein
MKTRDGEIISPVIHVRCEGLVFFDVRKTPTYGDCITAKHIYKTDGTQPQSGEPIGNCQHCGNEININGIERLLHGCNS